MKPLSTEKNTYNHQTDALSMTLYMSIVTHVLPPKKERPPFIHKKAEGMVDGASWSEVGTFVAHTFAPNDSDETTTQNQTLYFADVLTFDF